MSAIRPTSTGVSRLRSGSSLLVRNPDTVCPTDEYGYSGGGKVTFAAPARCRLAEPPCGFEYHLPECRVGVYRFAQVLHCAVEPHQRGDFLRRKGNPRRMVLMRVSGDSMVPEIFDNDLVLLDQGQTEITPGRLYAVGFEDAIYIKRIDMLPGKIILRSVNPAYAPVTLDLRGDCAEQFRVIGRVLWSGREYR